MFKWSSSQNEKLIEGKKKNFFLLSFANNLEEKEKEDKEVGKKKNRRDTDTLKKLCRGSCVIYSDEQEICALI